MIIPCLCGKQLCFESQAQANRYIEDPKSPKELVKSYPCDIQDGVWHVTSKRFSLDKRRQPKSKIGKLKLLEEELHQQMATVKELIVHVMEAHYKGTGEYKFHTAQVKGLLKKDGRFSGTDNAVASGVFQLKKDNVIVDLDEKVQGGHSRATYFALAKHLDEVTKPKTNTIKPEEVKTVAENKTDEKPTPKVIIPPQNPFDKVNSTLGEILSKVNGLATGYGDLVKNSDVGPSRFNTILTRLDEIKSSTPTVDTTSITKAVVEELMPILAQINTAIKATQKSTVRNSVATSLDMANLAEVINDRLADLTKDNSFIYRVREEMDDRVYRAEKQFSEMFSKLMPPNYATLTDEEKYQKGIQDGIRLAVQMGLILPDV